MPSKRRLIPSSGSYCTATPSGTSCGGCAGLRGADATHGQIIVIEQNTTAATRFLDWLTNHDLTLATAGQGDLEAWLISRGATLREKAGHFIRWASANKLTSLHFPAVKWGGPAAVIDTEDRWDQARRVLHDATLNPKTE